MIEIEDLRIGNTILFDSEIDSVVSIYSKGVDGEFKSRWSSDRLHGIKLTPEILIKYGFTKELVMGKTDKYWYQLGELSFNELHDGWWFRGKFNDINTLHQLQNLYYSLVGIELKIVW